MAARKSKGAAPLSKKAARSRGQQIRERKAALRTAGGRRSTR
jgi:hypothetical protein